MTKRDLRVSLVQGDTRWHDPAGNREHYAALMAPMHGNTDLIVLPETFTSGFSNDAIGNAETMDGPTVAWLREQAARLDAAICGSVQLRTPEGRLQNNVYNRMLFVRPDGSVEHYDKRHLFTYAGEHERYAAGHDRLIVEWRDWKICPLVCYDLRFPVFSRNRLDANGEPEYDLLVYVANWPSPRAYAWKTLLRARAIENVCFVAGVNRCGTDGYGLHYSGDSTVLDFLGHPLSECAAAEVTTTTTLLAADLADWRAKFPALRDGDRYSID